MRRAAILGLAAALAACAPITSERELDGRNAYNRLPNIIVIDPRAPDRAAVWAQEAYELDYKSNPAAALSVRTSRQAERRMEIASHEVETQAAAAVYGRDPDAYRAREAATMRRGYGGLFSGWTETALIEAMRARTPLARRWVERHRSAIEAQK